MLQSYSHFDVAYKSIRLKSIKKLNKIQHTYTTNKRALKTFEGTGVYTQRFWTELLW